MTAHASRSDQHRGYLTSIFPTKVTGNHLNQQGHSVIDVSTRDETHHKGSENTNNTRLPKAVPQPLF